MASTLQIASPDAIRRIQRVQTVTITWMTVEAAVSLFASWRAHSPALLASGGDSAIELFSSIVVLWRFRTTAHGETERRAALVAGALLFVLAAFVAVTSVTGLLGYSEPKPTILGIGILIAAVVVVPWLAREKRRLSGATGSAALRADAARVGALCLPLAHCLDGTGDQRHLAGQVGRPGCGFSSSAAYRVGGSRSHTREDLRLYETGRFAVVKESNSGFPEQVHYFRYLFLPPAPLHSRHKGPGNEDVPKQHA